MVDPITIKQLTSEAQSLRRADEQASPSRADAYVEDAPVLARGVIEARYAEISDDALVLSVDAEDPHTRLAACWRLMVRDQALGTAPPTDGVRLLLMINVASVQNLELLMVVAELDPCPTVRGAAVTFLWRVARDRDRVVEWLLARLVVERAPATLLALFNLDPPLPFALALPGLRPHPEHPVADVRAAALREWIANDGDDAAQTCRRGVCLGCAALRVGRVTDGTCGRLQ